MELWKFGKHENQGDHYYDNNKLNKIIHSLCR